ncbi:MAG: hypothetical protein QOD42_2137 [Sphingomonadales bacterium]|jgi:hypothetical protein|nr:hypothetical protein [Sphingomonadales bacterium]
MLNRLLIPAALLLLAASAPAQEPAERPLDPICPRHGADRPTGAEWLCNGELTRDYAFAFVYPAAAQSIPALKQLLHDQAELDRALLVREVWAVGHPAIPYSYDAQWRMDAVTPELAAASGEIRSFRGGPQSGLDYRAILIDRRADREIRLIDLFAPNLFENSLFGRRIRGIRAVQASFCRALAAQMRARRGEPAAQIACPDIETQPITLVCGPRGRIEAMRALLNPYVMGGWADGPYQVDFRLDARIIGNMKQRYRNAFGMPGERRGRPRTC